MRTVRPDQDDLPNLQGLAKRLKKANGLMAFAIKERDITKAGLSDWLKQKRNIDTEVLAIGEMINIEGVVLLEVAKQNRFDEKGFGAAEPKLHEAYKKEFPMLKFKPLS
jgi:hypothetical protein